VRTKERETMLMCCISTGAKTLPVTINSRTLLPLCFTGERNEQPPP